jgi:uncharacterized membrane protein
VTHTAHRATPVAVRGAYATLGVMVAAMIATPLFAQRSDERTLLASVVVLSFFATALLSTWCVYRWRAVMAAAVVIVATYVVELLGSTTGVPFGAYEYTDQLHPQIAGVPLVVSFAWAAITLTAFGMFAGRMQSMWLQLVVMAVAITAWDVFLDPQMVAEGYWTWKPASLNFRGIPLVNYLGWFATALMNSAMVIAVCRPAHRFTRQIPLATYAVITVLSTIGFFFFFDDAVVAAVGLATMGTCTWLAYRLSRVAASSHS